MILTLIFSFGLIEYVLSIQCFTCNRPGFYCFLPLNIDPGDDSTINDISNPTYDSDYICQSDHFIDYKTGEEKLIMRGTKSCHELDLVNRRTYCCYTDNCNKWLPPMTRRAFASSDVHRYVPSIILTGLFIILQYCY